MDIFSTQSKKKVRTHLEEGSELPLKGKMRLHQLAEIDPAEIVISFTNSETASLWVENEHRKELAMLTTNNTKANSFS